ncbi:hypothetical protein DRE_02599 [Drechslerella stenobrocha 248]|uniref:Mid2 domain-containing protein n=1 Tax=Drechslerella stenobrocha 248 TaxID=1043628 RepID=W7IFU8_9PEZI|nr:hypothetical protein DRE_02599 [Drechslerella stenobrocha 248]
MGRATSFTLSWVPCLVFFLGRALAEDLTTIVPVLTSLGTLSAFTPPTNCFSTSIWRTSRFYDDSNQSGNLQTRFFTRWYVGCNINQDTGEYNTCCPPQFNTWGFYAPGVCPSGYTSLGGNLANPWVGDQRGTVCCPVVQTPTTVQLTSAAFVTSNINPLTRSPISISCFEWSDDSTTSGTIYQGNYNARAIIVFESQLTSPTFQFAQFGGSDGGNSISRPRATSSSSARSTSESTSEESSSTEPETTPSPGSTSSTTIETGLSESTTLRSSLSDPNATASPQGKTEGEGGKSGLSGGAIAGIAIGVAIPVVAIAVFVAYRMGRRKEDMPSVPIYNDPTFKEGGGIAQGHHLPGEPDGQYGYYGRNL